MSAYGDAVDYAEWLLDWLSITGGALVLWPHGPSDQQPVIWPGLHGKNRINDVYRKQRRRRHQAPATNQT